jgi:hypothetical protein
MDYKKQADDFMTKTGTTMEAVLLGTYKYFADDKDKRDVYKITLKRNGKEYSFDFGQSLANSYYYKEAEAQKKAYRANNYGFFKPIKKSELIPTCYDVLASIEKYDTGSFDDWCSNFGYETDSRKALETYLKCQEQFDNINRLFHDVLDELAEIN